MAGRPETPPPERPPPEATLIDSRSLARALGVSIEAIELQRTAGAVDLHVESFIWSRILRYDLGRRHDRWPTRGRLLGQCDVPRMRDGGITGAWMSIATNPFRSMQARRRAVRLNVARLRRALIRAGCTVVNDAAAFDRARSRGEIGCFLAVQGANCLLPDDLAMPALSAVSRATLVHLTPSRYGSPSTNLRWRSRRGLPAAGRAMVEAIKAHGVLLDLAHASPRTFWEAMDVHGHAAPVIVSHTGVRAVRDSWRNIDDDQIRAIASTGGVVGVMLHAGFLAKPARQASVVDVARHIEHVIRIGGEGAAAIGSDYDGFILPPRDLRSVAALPRLTQALLDRGHSPDRIARVLATNALRPLRTVRPGSPGTTAQV